MNTRSSSLIPTPSQRRFLVLTALREIGLNVAIFAFLIVVIWRLNPLVSILLALLIVFYFGWFARDYWQDLRSEPAYACGRFEKYEVLGRRKNYAVSNKQLLIRVPKQVWKVWQPALTYELWYGKHSGWLLAHKTADD